MPNWEHSELFLFLLFFVPGFISLKIYDLLIPGDRRDVRSVLTEAIGYSSINFAILSPIIFLFVFGHGAFHYLGVQMAAIFFFLFVAPAIWPFLLVRIFRSRQAARYLVNLIPKPWDVVFRGLGESWIIVHMADGRRVGGRYAKGSQASSYPADEQLYLKEVWRLDEEGRFIGKVERTGGVIVGMKDVQALEFFEA